MEMELINEIFCAALSHSVFFFAICQRRIWYVSGECFCFNKNTTNVLKKVFLSSSVPKYLLIVSLYINMSTYNKELIKINKRTVCVPKHMYSMAAANETKRLKTIMKQIKMSLSNCMLVRTYSFTRTHIFIANKHKHTIRQQSQTFNHHSQEYTNYG